MRNADRVKSLGEVFTPMSLVSKMLRRLPRDTWTNPTKTVCDPTCGNGNFLVGVLRMKIAGGSKPEQALATTFGVDIMHDNVDECRERLLKVCEKYTGSERTPEWIRLVTKNIVCHDALTYDFEFGEDKKPTIIITDEMLKFAEDETPRLTSAIGHTTQHDSTKPREQISFGGLVGETTLQIYVTGELDTLRKHTASKNGPDNGEDVFHAKRNKWIDNKFIDDDSDKQCLIVIQGSWRANTIYTLSRLYGIHPNFTHATLEGWCFSHEIHGQNDVGIPGVWSLKIEKLHPMNEL